MDSGIDLRGQVALVTGAGRGIGRAAARALAAAGAEVAVLSRSADQVAETVALISGAGGHALALAGDVTDRAAVSASVQQVLGRFGQIDLLVNNAGANTVFGPAWEVDPEAWWADVRVNLLGPFLCSAAVLPAMIARRRGRIVNIASGTAGRAFPNNSSYAASKAALVRLTDCLAAETASHEVSVFALGPGTVRSAMSLGLERSAAGRRWLGDAIAALRFIPAEIPAAAIVLLASGRADELSGRWLDAVDDIGGIAAQASDVRDRDLFQLRRAKLPAAELIPDKLEHGLRWRSTMTDYHHLRIERGGNGLTRVTFARPPANALNSQVIDDVQRCAEELAADSPRVVVLASAAPMFMAGADLTMVDVGWDELRATIGRFQHAVNTWEKVPCPTIASINGHALGAGCEIALACDFRIMARGKARIGLPEVRRGLIAAGGGTQRTVRLLGRTHALNLSLRGLMIDADRAEQIGLITQAVDADDLQPVTQALADELLGLPTLTMAAIKRCINEGGDLDLAGGLAIEQREMSALGTTEDTREGVRAFVEKREPQFVGR